jgi:photosystem II stability/assembly factor-like uncharacterized protein
MTDSRYRPAPKVRLLAAILLFIVSSTTAASEWTNVLTIPTPYAALSIAAVPGEPSRVYVAAGGTVYRSDDGGDSWRSLVAPFRPDTLSVHPLNGDLVYVGTADALYRTRDGGETFEKVASELFKWGRARAAFDASGSQVYVTQDGRCDAPDRCTGAGVVTSSDGGDTWSEFAFPGQPVLHLALDPNDSMTMCAVVAHETDISLSRVYLTRDGGVTWSRHGNPASVVAVAIDTESRIYVVWSFMFNNIVHMTEDWGATWRQLKVPFHMTEYGGEATAAIFARPGWKNFVFAVTNENVWYSRDLLKWTALPRIRAAGGRGDSRAAFTRDAVIAAVPRDGKGFTGYNIYVYKIQTGRRRAVR